jgi:hypothetical protein
MDDLWNFPLTMLYSSVIIARPLISARRQHWNCILKRTVLADSAATLPGAMVVALGFHRTGFFTNAEALAQRTLQLGTRTGERMWQLPMDKEYKEQLKSDWADLIRADVPQVRLPARGSSATLWRTARAGRTSTSRGALTWAMAGSPAKSTNGAPASRHELLSRWRWRETRMPDSGWPLAVQPRIPS